MIATRLRASLTELLRLRLGNQIVLEVIQENDYNLTYSYLLKNYKFIARVSLKKNLEEVGEEVTIFRHLTKKGLPVPQAYDLFTLGSYPVYIRQYIEGKQVTKGGTSREIFLAYAADAGAALATIHAAGTDIDAKERPSPAFREIDRALKSRLKFKQSFSDADEFIRNLKWAKEFYLSQPRHGKPTIIHNDFRPQNILFSNSGHGIAAILDFDWSYIASEPIKDVAQSVLEWSMPDNDIRWDEKVMESFLEGYARKSSHLYPIDKLLLDWMKFSALSDASTYLLRTMKPTSGKQAIRSYMYDKFKIVSSTESRK